MLYASNGGLPVPSSPIVCVIFIRFASLGEGEGVESSSLRFRGSGSILIFLEAPAVGSSSTCARLLEIVSGGEGEGAMNSVKSNWTSV